MASAELASFLQKAVDDGVAPFFVATVTTSTNLIASAGVGSSSSPSYLSKSIDGTNTLTYLASMAKLPLSITALALIREYNFPIDSHEELVKWLPEFELGKGNEKPMGMIVDGWEEVELENNDDENKKKVEERPKLREAKVGVTLRHLLDQTSGILHQMTSKEGAYLFDWDEFLKGKLSAAVAPRMFEAGQGWEYGFSGEWVAQWIVRISGLTLEAAERKHIWDPLGVSKNDAGLILNSEQKSRLPGIFLKDPKSPAGNFQQVPFSTPMWEGTPPSGYAVAGSGGLYATADAFATLLRAILRGGVTDTGKRLLDEEMWKFGLSDALEPLGLKIHGYEAHGALLMGRMDEYAKLTPVDANIDQGIGWTYLNMAKFREPTTSGLSSGSLGWAGIANTFCFVDFENDVAGFIAPQVLPFMNEGNIRVRDEFERWVAERKKKELF